MEGKKRWGGDGFFFSEYISYIPGKGRGELITYGKNQIK
jgi:hypothetical protein